MLFDIFHKTEYRYSNPASEAYLELRMTPPQTSSQTLLSHSLALIPQNPTSAYTDYFGNKTDFYSMTLRHDHLSIVNRMRVKTQLAPRPAASLASTVAEARQIINSSLTNVYDYLLATDAVPVGGIAKEWGSKWFRADAPLGEALESLNHTIHKRFTYCPGSTTNDTPLEKIWKQRKGVCQDFAHIMLCVLRTAGIPARYVCGYIESVSADAPESATQLVGSVATHAWVEALLPGQVWVALDPTNDCWCGEQHVTVSYGRDFREAAPVIGTFKTSGHQYMKVKVLMKRISEKS